MAASSSSSSNVRPTPVLDELFAVSGETLIPKAMSFYFEQKIIEEKLEGDYIKKKIADVNANLKRVRKAIHEIESKTDKDAWEDSLGCFRDIKGMLEVKLSRWTQLESENEEGVKQLKVHTAIMELCSSDDEE